MLVRGARPNIDINIGFIKQLHAMEPAGLDPETAKPGMADIPATS
jgi:hypothetical protein